MPREAAIQQHALVDDQAREEDQSFAEADLRLAEAQLQEAESATKRHPFVLRLTASCCVSTIAMEKAYRTRRQFLIRL
jgi:hypothetical protein